MRALSIASTGMEAQQLSIEVIANNLANISTVGFKKGAWDFQDLMYETLKVPGTNTSTGVVPVGMQLGTGVVPVSVYRTFRQGDFQQTGNPLDMAIQGDGFFQVSLPDGSTAYTRAGSFKLDNQGHIVTVDGYEMLPGLTIPQTATKVSISTDGVVSVTTAGSSTATKIGTIELARFTNPAGLESLGQNLFRESMASGSVITGTAGLQGFGLIQQGALESSNVNIAEEMVNMIVAQRAYEINTKAIQVSDQILQYANNLRQ